MTTPPASKPAESSSFAHRSLVSQKMLFKIEHLPEHPPDRFPSGTSGGFGSDPYSESQRLLDR